MPKTVKTVWPRICFQNISIDVNVGSCGVQQWNIGFHLLEIKVISYYVDKQFAFGLEQYKNAWYETHSGVSNNVRCRVGRQAHVRTLVRVRSRPTLVICMTLGFASWKYSWQNQNYCCHTSVMSMYNFRMVIEEMIPKAIQIFQNWDRFWWKLTRCIGSDILEAIYLIEIFLNFFIKLPISHPNTSSTIYHR